MVRIIYLMINSFNSPLQFTPLPKKPFLHAHVNDPFVFVHVAWTSQLCVLLVHSLTSTTIKIFKAIFEVLIYCAETNDKLNCLAYNWY